MSKHAVLAIVAGFIVMLIIGGIFYSKLRSNLSEEEKLRAEQYAIQKQKQAIQNLEQAVGEGTAAPSTNPLGENLPEVNPIDRANPFKVYQNPFQ